MSCNGNVYNIGMGCCEPVLGPVENYYTKPTIDRKLEEITSAITSGCCITPEEVDEKIEEAISGITVSGVTEEELNEAIASAKTEIEAEIPSLDGYATQQWVEDQQYITGVDLSNYALKSEIPTVPTSNTAFTNDAGYLTEHQSLSGYATTAFVSAFTYDKATIDEKVAGGGSFDPSQYYNKTATDALLDEKLYVTAYTPTDLSNYYTKTEVDNEIISAITDVEAEIPTVPTSNTAFTNDAGYLTEHQSLSGYATEEWVEDKHYITGVDLSNYATKDNLTAATDDMATKTWVNNQGYLTEHQSLTAYSTTQEVNTMITQSVSGKQDTLIAGENITISGNVISATGGGSSNLPISAGTGTDSVKENYVNNVASGSYSHAEGRGTSASGDSSHAEGNGTSAKGNYAHAEGHSTVASGDSSHAEGELTNANGIYSHVEGTSTKANNVAAHAEGRSTTASGKYAHTEGMLTVASGQSAHAEGNSTRANGSNSHAEGDNTIANNESEHASGEYNVSNTGESTSAQTLFSVGNGGWDEAAQDVVRHNAFEIRKNGDIYLSSGGTDIKLQDHLGGGGGVTIDPTLDSGSTNPVANSAITEAVLVPSYRGLIEVEDDAAFPNATALYVENVTSGAYTDSAYYQINLSGVSSVVEILLVSSFSGHTFGSELQYVDYEWTSDNSLILTPKESGNYFWRVSKVWKTGFGVYIIDDYSSGSSSSVIQNEIYPRITNLTEKVDSFNDTKVTGVTYNNLYSDYGGYWYHEIEIFDNASGHFAAQDKLRYNDFGYDNGVITVKKTSGVTSGSTECLTSGGAYQALSEKPDVWCGTFSQWSQISGNTQPNTIYLVY